MKHFGNFVALLILAINALFTGLLLLVAYSPYIQPVSHPVQSCLTGFSYFRIHQRGIPDFLAHYTTIQDSFTAFNRFPVVLFATTDVPAPQFSYIQTARKKCKAPLVQHHGI